MKMIVAVDENWGIGRNNRLLFHISEDMKFFREKTLSKIVVMGRNTLLSFPNGQPLKNRKNIVLASVGFEREDCTVVHSLDQLMTVLSEYDSNDIFVIGGGMLYKALQNYCDEAFITKIFANGNADVFLDNFDKLNNWELIYSSPVNLWDGVAFKFTTYKNNSFFTQN